MAFILIKHLLCCCKYLPEAQEGCFWQFAMYFIVPEKQWNLKFPFNNRTVVVLSLIWQSCVWLCDSMDRRLPGSPVNEIFQARILEWVAISCSRGSSQPRDQTPVFCISCTGRWILYHWGTWWSFYTSIFADTTGLFLQDKFYGNTSTAICLH